MGGGAYAQVVQAGIGPFHLGGHGDRIYTGGNQRRRQGTVCLSPAEFPIGRLRFTKLPILFIRAEWNHWNKMLILLLFHSHCHYLIPPHLFFHSFSAQYIIFPCHLCVRVSLGYEPRATRVGESEARWGLCTLPIRGLVRALYSSRSPGSGVSQLFRAKPHRV